MIFYDRTYSLVVYRADGKPIDAPSTGQIIPSFFETLANGIEITGSDITFDIEKSTAKQPNKGDITIYNLSEHTAGIFGQTTSALTVRLLAGYDNVQRLLFQGGIRYVSDELTKTERVTKLILSDGGRAYDNAQVSKSYSQNTPMRTILRDCAAALGLRLPREIDADPALDGPAPIGVVLDGYAQSELSRLLGPYGYSWSVQNGQLQILRDNQVRLNAEYVVNRQDSGLLGSPKYGYHARAANSKSKKPKVLLTFATMLYPELAPGVRVRLDSESAQGPHKILKVRHTGDTGGDEWTTTCEAVPL